MALAKVAQQHSYIRPELVSDASIEIKGGRHPLLELYTDQFTRNDTFCSKSHGLLKFITGANASGKSVYLKQVRNITLLLEYIITYFYSNFHFPEVECLLVISIINRRNGSKASHYIVSDFRTITKDMSVQSFTRAFIVVQFL